MLKGHMALRLEVTLFYVCVYVGEGKGCGICASEGHVLSLFLKTRSLTEPELGLTASQAQ